MGIANGPAATTVGGVKSLPDRLQWVLRERRISRRRWSLAAGLSQSHVGQLIRGDLEAPSAESLHALARAAGVSFRWLATGEGSPDPIVEGERRPEQELPAVPYLGDLPDWPELLADARATDPGVPAWVWDVLTRTRAVPNLPRWTPAAVVDLARFTLRHYPRPRNR